MIEDRDQTLISTPTWEFKLELGREFLDKNELPLAEKMLKDGLKLAVKKFGEDDPRLARIHSALAEVYSKKKDYKKSESNYKKVLEVCEKAIGPNYKVLAKTLEKYADLLKKMKRDRDAEQIQQRSQIIARKIKAGDQLKGQNP